MPAKAVSRLSRSLPSGHRANSMGNLISGLLIGQPLGVWVAGIVVAVAYLSSRVSVRRIGVLLAAIIWPTVPVGMALITQRDALQAADEFLTRCERDASEKVHRQVGPVAQVTFETDRHPLGSLVSQINQDIVSRLITETPGYSAIYTEEIGESKGSSSSRVWRRDRSPSRKADSSSAGSDTPRYVVRIETAKSATSDFLGYLNLTIRDRKTSEVLAEQRTTIYHSADAGVGGYPIWRRQVHGCPLSHPADFVRSTLVPMQE